MSRFFSSLHFLYASLISLIIFTTALFQSRDLLQWLTLLLFLPVLSHFLIEIYKKIYLFRYRLAHPAPHTSSISSTPIGFNLFHFLTQEDAYFLVSLGLLCVLVSSTILKYLFTP